MRLDLGGQPWASHDLTNSVLSRFEEPLELCEHLRVRRAEIRRVALPDTPQQKRFDKPEPLKHRLLRVVTLELDHNELEEIDGDGFQFPNLEYLDISFNRIHRISHARMFLTRLRVCILRRNKLSNLRWLFADGVRLPMSHLDVSFNMIQSISDTAEIVNLFDLETLDISNNPLEGDLTVEAFCMLGCPQLTHLNGQAVSDVARARARTWCDESDAGRAIAEYVSELHGYYSKPGRALEQRSSQPTAQDLGLSKRNQNLIKTSPTVKDPLGYLQQANVAVDFLMQAAEQRTFTTTKRHLFSTMQLREFDHPKGHQHGPKLIPWKYWAQEMRRLGRRISDTKGKM
jgi:hypothetical protein